MVKTLVFLKRKASISHEECIKHHRDIHVPLVLEAFSSKRNLLPLRYVAYYLNEGPDVPYDLIIEQWFKDEDWKQVQELRKSPAYQKVRQDVETWLDGSHEKINRVTFVDNVVI